MLLVPISVHETLIYRLPLLQLSVGRRFRLLLAMYLICNSSWRQWQHVSVLLPLNHTVVSCLIIGAIHAADMSSARHTVGSIGPVLWSFDHGRQLKLLVVRVVTLFSRVPLSVSVPDDFLI